MQSLPQNHIVAGTTDGAGGEYDQPYSFGHRPRSEATFPFDTRQYARLLVLRSRIQAGLDQRYRPRES